MSRGFIYIINPISGPATKKNIRSVIEKKTKAAGFRFFIFPSVADGDYDFLRDVIKTEKITDIIVAGGDGTVRQVVASLHDTGLRFGILPCGSGNGLAFAAGIPKNLEKALQIVFNGKAKITDAFIINGEFSCMLCGLGFDAAVAHSFAEQPARGLATYVKEVIKNFIKAKSYRFEIRTSKNNFSVDAYFISIANSNQFGNHFTIAPGASLSDGKIDVVIMAARNRLSVLLQTLKQVGGFTSLQNGSHIDEKKGVIYFQTDKLAIVNTDSAPLHIDGDPAETPMNIEIEVKKHLFYLLRP